MNSQSQWLWKIAFLAVSLELCYFSQNVCADSETAKDLPEELDFYSFPVVDIQENIVSLEMYRGKVSLVVNVASECGYTDNHYKALRLLQEMFSDTKKFNVLAFPCNQFGHQEPGTHNDIYEFAYNRMGANFPLFAKINVLEHDVPPAWTYLMKQSGKVPTWNFWKYLVDHNGHVVNAWGPSTSPEQLYQNIKDAINNIEKDKKKNKDDQKRDEF